MLLTSTLTSKGVAGVSLRASLVVIAATLSQFNLPEEGLLLIMAITRSWNMGRSATNVIGNSLATAVVAKWEGNRLEQRRRYGGDDRGDGSGTGMSGLRAPPACRLPWPAGGSALAEEGALLQHRYHQ